MIQELPVLNREHHDPSKQIDEKLLTARILTLAQTLSGKRFYPYQIEFGGRIIEAVLLHEAEILCGLMSRQSGKCLAPGTLVKMADGTDRKVEDVRVGDFVLGASGKPLKVNGLASGKEEMFEIKSIGNYGTAYTVNKSHILSLFSSSTSKVVNIEVSDYLKLSPHKKADLKGYRASVDFSQKILPVEPKTYGIDVSSKGVGEYFGFSLEGDDKLFLLSDYTVTHNTETLAGVMTSLALILPYLAKQFPDDWKLNITDDSGVYRGFGEGIKIGIYAPRLDQARIMFERVKAAFSLDIPKAIMKEMGLTVEVANGNTLRLSSGSRIICESASEQSKIEGETHHLLVLDEAQDISDLKIRKSLEPMTSATAGCIIKIGTSKPEKCDFYDSIKTAMRVQSITGKKTAFIYPYQVCIKFNSLYKQAVQKAKERLGEDSDEFQASYCCKWVFERGMFLTAEQLFNSRVAETVEPFNQTWERGLTGRFLHSHSRFSIVAGIDWGEAHDSTVVTLMAVDWNTPLDTGTYFNSLTGRAEDFQFYEKHIVYWKDYAGDNYEEQFWKIHELLINYHNLVKIVTDANTAGAPIYARLSAAFKPKGVEVVPIKFTPKDKSNMYKTLYSDICGHRLTFPAGVEARKTREYSRFVQEMLDLHKSYNNGLLAVSHPNEKNAHDDYPDSVALACWGCQFKTSGNTIDFSAKNMFFRRS